MIEFTFYVPCEEKGTAPLLMQDMVALIGKPVSMFSLTVKNTDGCHDVCANDEFFFKPAAGPKADALTASAAELQSLPSENKHKFTREHTRQPREARDFLSMGVLPISASMLAEYFGATRVSVDDTVFQMNYVDIDTPGPGANVLTDNGERIWISSTRTRDFSGSIDLAIREKAALALAGLNPEADFAKAEFLEMVQKGSLQVSLLSSVRIHVRLKSR